MSRIDVLCGLRRLVFKQFLLVLKKRGSMTFMGYMPHFLLVPLICLGKSSPKLF